MLLAWCLANLPGKPEALAKVLLCFASRVAPLEDADTYASALAYVDTQSTGVTVALRLRGDLV